MYKKRILKNLVSLLLVSYLVGVTTTAVPYDTQRYWRFDSNPLSSQSNLWKVMGQRFRMTDDYANNYYVQKQIRWYRKQGNYVNDLSRNAQPYLYYVYQQTRKRGMPAEIALLPMIESDYNPFVYSNRGATGLWQLMPGTASGFGLVINWWYDGRRDVVASTNAALNELQYLHDYFHSWSLALAAYDAGQGAVMSAIHYNKRHGLPTDFWSLHLPQETKTYVPKLLAIAEIIQHPKQYHVQLTPVANQPYFTTVTLNKQVKFNHLAVLAESSPKLMRDLNAGFRRTTTLPHHGYNILVPLKTATNFKDRLAANSTMPSSGLAKQLVYRPVQSNDSLKRLSSRYDLSFAELRNLNKIGTHAAQIGQDILIPTAQAEPYFNAHSRQVSEDGLPGPRRVIYTLHSHETLNHVARRFHVAADDIWFWNEFTDNTKIHGGMKLTLWVSPRYARGYESYSADNSSSNVVSKPTVSHHKAAKQTIHHTNTYATYYRVKPGDNLDDLAYRFHTTTHRLRTLNHLHTGILQIGQHLKIA